MKRCHFSILCLTLIVCACSDEKEKQGCDDLTITQVSDHAVSQTDLATIKNLLQANNIAYDNLRFTSFDNNDALDSEENDFTSLEVQQYTNGLPIFFSDTYFNFLNGNVSFFTGELYPNTTETINTKQKLKLAEVRTLFTQELIKKNKGIVGLENECLIMEFGYVDLNGEVSGLPPNLKKAWYVRPLSKIMLWGVFLDDDGSTYHFF
jgi:hypothetical protein